MELAEEMSPNLNAEKNTLYEAAHILRREVLKCEEWTFSGSLTDVNERHVPVSLYSFFRWLLQGPVDVLSSEKKTAKVNKHAMSLAQTTVSMCLTKRQVSNQQTKGQKTQRGMPQQLAVGLAVRQAYRDKKVVNLLHGFGLSVDYQRLLRLEAQLASAVIERMLLKDGLYIPSDIVLGRHVFFAVDNVDFAEDTPDGKNTLHAIAIAIYQQQFTDDPQRCIKEIVPSHKYSLQDLPPTLTSLLEHYMPKNVKPQSPSYPTFHLPEYQATLATPMNHDIAWLLGHALLRSNIRQHQEDFTSEDMEVDESEECDESKCNDEGSDKSQMDIPTWSAYNSMNHQVMPLIRVSPLPLIAAPAHDFQTLLTVLKQAQAINTHVVGTNSENSKTMISLDMGLYKPAKQLQMSRDDLQDIVLRPGELHIVMAILQCIGVYIENSGIDFCWTEAGLYGPATAKQIIDGNHVKRGIDAHLITLQALFVMYETIFSLEHPDIQAAFTEISQKLNAACVEGDIKEIQEACSVLDTTVEALQVKEMMKAFDAKNETKPLFKVMCQYMHMVVEMLAFIKSVRTGNWKLHLAALQAVTKYFFAHDRLVYALMIPLYLADMENLQRASPAIYKEFCQGNWVVNKNPDVAFCVLGADHALEHVNRSMKVSGGLIGITLNPKARTKFFLVAPELARLTEEAQDMAGLTTSPSPTKHHELSGPTLQSHEVNVLKLTDTFRNFTDPFAVDSDVLSILPPWLSCQTK